MRYERTRIEGGQHGLQAGEVGAPWKYDQRRMQKLAVQLLRFEEIVGALGLPFSNGPQVLDPFLVEQVDDSRAQIPAEPKVWDLGSKWDRLRRLPLDTKAR